MNRWLSTPFVFAQKPEKIDEENGVIYGAAVVTEGEAKGHGVFLDSEFVDEVIRLGNELDLGLKVRFGHPNMSSEALGTYAGRAKNFRRDGVIARADITLSKSAQDAPSGDLYTYLLTLSKTEPDVFGLSIVFVPGGEYKRDEKTGKKIKREDSEWSAIDGRIYQEIQALRGVDFVDDPAANPGGLFNAFSGDTWAGQVTEFLDSHPHIFKLCTEHPEIIQNFMARYEDYRSRMGQPVSAEVRPEKQEVKNMTREEYLQAKNLYGPAVAMQVFESGGTLDDCAKLSAENMAKEMESAKAELAKLQAEKAEVEKQLAAAKQAPAFQEEAPAKAAVDCRKLHAEYRAAGMSAAAAWRRIATEHPAEYKAHIRKEN